MWLGAANRSISKIIVPPPVGSLRFFPGFYGCFDYGGSGGTSTGRATVDANYIVTQHPITPANGIPPDNLQGFSWTINWRTMDTGTTTGPVYNFSVNDQMVAACHNRNKRYWIWVNPYALSAGTTHSCSAGTKCVPDWLINTQGMLACQGNYSTLGRGTFPKMYNSVIANAFFDLLVSLINRYESDPLCEGIGVGIGSALPSFNGVDTVGTRYPNVNYNSDYSDAGMVAWYNSLAVRFRVQSKILNLWLTTDYLFNEAGSSSWSGQDVQWGQFFDNCIANKACVGGPDSWTRSWIYPQVPFTSTGQNSYAPHTNPTYQRSVYSDGVYRGWRSANPGVGVGYRGRIKFCGCIELTEMGGYIGQYTPADIWSWRGPSLDNSHYMHVDINYSGTGNFGINNAPNTLWIASAAYETTYGQSVYPWIQGAGSTNVVNPY